MNKKNMQTNSRNGRLFFFLTLTGMVVCLSSAEALPTIYFTGDSDSAGHSSLTNTAKWTDGITPVTNNASKYEFVLDKNNLRTLNNSDTTLNSSNFTVKGGVLALANNGTNNACFKFPKLTLYSGKLGNFYAKSTILNGPVVITAPDTEPF